MENNNDIVFVGDEHPMRYAEEVARLFAFKDKKEVKILARGRYISNAVNVAEIVKNRLLEGKNSVKVISVNIGTDNLPNREKGNDSKKNISTIEIVLGKNE
jgi:DNA-binding protein Alba